MKSKVRHINFSPDEYIAGVAGQLSAEEQGIYWMICSLVMSHGGNVDNDPQRIGRLVCLGTAKTRNIIKKLISMGKIQEKSGKIHQKRAENEVKKAKKRIEIARNNGSQPKKNKTLTEAGAYSPASLPSSTITIKKERKKESKKDSLPARPPSSNQPCFKNSKEGIFQNEPVNKAENVDNSNANTEKPRPDLKSATYEKAREDAPGYDIYFIEEKWISSGFAAKAKNPDTAFLGFVRKHVKGNPL